MHTSKELQAKLSEHSKIFYVFDYDGTLTPIVEQRNEAILTAEQVEKINQVHKDHQVAIVTGRGLANLQELLDRAPAQLDPSILLIGSHGAEISGTQQNIEFTETLDNLASRLKEECGDLDLEKKQISLAVHYRGHSNPDALLTRLNKIAQDYQDQFRVQEGLLVYEFVPKQINKSLAIDFIHQQYPDHYLVYFGDDYTDCFAFDRVNELGGLTVQIDSRIKSSAQIKIKSVNDLYINLKS